MQAPVGCLCVLHRMHLHCIHVDPQRVLVKDSWQRRFLHTVRQCQPAYMACTHTAPSAHRSPCLHLCKRLCACDPYPKITMRGIAQEPPLALACTATTRACFDGALMHGAVCGNWEWCRFQDHVLAQSLAASLASFHLAPSSMRGIAQTWPCTDCQAAWRSLSRSASTRAISSQKRGLNAGLFRKK